METIFFKNYSHALTTIILDLEDTVIRLLLSSIWKSLWGNWKAVLLLCLPRIIIKGWAPFEWNIFLRRIKWRILLDILWQIFTHFYAFLCIFMHFSHILRQSVRLILRWILRIFTHFYAFLRISVFVLTVETAAD